MGDLRALQSYGAYRAEFRQAKNAKRNGTGKVRRFDGEEDEQALGWAREFPLAVRIAAGARRAARKINEARKRNLPK